MSIVPALGNGDIRTVPTLWDGQTDNKALLDLTIDNLQQGDLIEVTLTLSGAGYFQWNCASRLGDMTFVASNQGIFSGESVMDLSTFADRSWMVLLQSNTTQSITIGLDHSACTAKSSEIGRDGSSDPMKFPWMPDRSVTPGYRISNVTLAAGLIGKTYY